jgi:ketosteroid isomerase-like protein
VATVAALAACAGGGATATPWDLALDEVIAAERDFARLALDSTVHHAFVERVASDAVIFRPGPVPAAAWLRENPMPADLRLEWQPAFADVALAGDIGWTTGPWRAGSKSDSATTAAGRYVTIWRNEPAGWRYVIDFGVETSTFTPVTSIERAPPPDLLADSVRDAQTDQSSLHIADEDLNAAIGAMGDGAWDQYADSTLQWLRDGGRSRTLASASGTAVPMPAGDGRAADERTWSTLAARVARSGDLGYTWGSATAVEDTTAAPHYVRIWRRRSDGSWRVILDAATGLLP